MMIKIGICFCAIFASSLASPAAERSQSPAKIVGGKEADIKYFPYQVAVLYFESQICGGTLVTYQSILSAAHCVTNKTVRFFSMRVGSNNCHTGGQHIYVQKLIVHPFYDQNTTENDAVIFILKKPFARGVGVQIIELNRRPILDGSYVLISGWGTTSEKGSSTETLRYTWIRLVNWDLCKKILGKLLTANTLCAGTAQGGMDTCQGDSGGPAVVGNLLVGVVSWGVGCGRPNVPGVYTDVAAIITWIEKNIV